MEDGERLGAEKGSAAFLGGNSSKAGLPSDGLDRARIDRIIEEASKGSKFFEYQRRREERIKGRCAALRKQMELLSRDPDAITRAAEQVESWRAELERLRDLESTFIHVDMDAFFAAVETLRRPELGEMPMAVGGDSMLCTANYHARKYGVVSAMPGYIAKQLCPHLVIIPPNSAAYREASAKVRHILAEYDPKLTVSSLDEATLNVSEYLRAHPELTAEALTAELRHRIFQTTRLTCSAGVSVNKRLAKICANVNKPNGQFVLPPKQDAIVNFLALQPVKRLNGVGKVTAKILEDLLQIKTCAELVQCAPWIKLLFSPLQADFLLSSALGLCQGGSDPEERWTRKSISVERTFKTLSTLSALDEVLLSLCQSLADDLAEHDVAGRTVAIKMKTSAFEMITRAVTLEHPVCSEEDIYKPALRLLVKHRPKDLRLLGVRMSGLVPRKEALRRSFRAIHEYAAEERTEKPACPICSREIDAHPDDTVRINEHIDRCIAEASGDPPLAKRRGPLDRFFAKTKS